MYGKNGVCGVYGENGVFARDSSPLKEASVSNHRNRRFRSRLQPPRHPRHAQVEALAVQELRRLCECVGEEKEN